MYCPNCGSPRPEGSNSCPQCSKEYKLFDQNQQNVSKPKGSNTGLIIAIVIALFFGFRSCNLDDSLAEANLTLETANERITNANQQISLANELLQRQEVELRQITSDKNTALANAEAAKQQLVKQQQQYDANLEEWKEALEKWKEAADKSKYYFYYVKSKQRYGVYELDYYLNSWTWARKYEAGVFDCSNMSAYVERDLETEGFHTLICYGNSPDGTGRHAWLLVEAEVGTYMPVECTTDSPSVVWWDYPYFDNYFIYDGKFETIQEAIAYAPKEYNWWDN